MVFRAFHEEEAKDCGVWNTEVGTWVGKECRGCLGEERMAGWHPANTSQRAVICVHGGKLGTWDQNHSGEV